MASWSRVFDDVFLFRDSCNVYALVNDGQALIVDAGTGRWLDHLDDLPARPAALVCTHFFRDHSAGAGAAARAGIPVFVPEIEAPLFKDPVIHFQQRETYIIYENYWHHFAPVEPVEIAGELRDYERRRLAGIDIEVVPLPGVTVGQVGLLIQRDQGVLAVCGETIHSYGRVARLSPLQWGYNDLGGAVALLNSVREIRRMEPQAVLPSLGEPIVTDPEAALRALEDTLREMMSRRLDPSIGADSATGPAFAMLDPNRGQLAQVTDHVWRSSEAGAISTFLVSSNGGVLAIDYGYNLAIDVPGQSLFARPTTRRALLHSLDGLEAVAGTRRIDVVLPTHYHDDHVAGIPLLQRLMDTECWAAESFADILSHPSDFAYPCTWPVPIKVDRRLPLPSEIRFREYNLMIGPSFSGHTRFAALIGFEADGVRIAHTGDQYHGAFYWDAQHETDWRHERLAPNEVYRNGMSLNGYSQSAEWLVRWRPDVVLTGHQRPLATDDAFFQRVEEQAREIESTHRRLMPLGDSEAHFDADSWQAWIRPYRVHLAEPGNARVTVSVRNPLPREARLDLRLVMPEGWNGGDASVVAGPRAEASCELVFSVGTRCRRQPFAVELSVDGRPYGQVAEALVSVDPDRF